MEDSIMLHRKVEPYKRTLNSGAAYWMARLSKEIYTEVGGESNAPDVDKILQSLQKDDPDFVDVKAVEQGNSEAALVEHERYLCMVFRGTDEWKDWLDNINVPLVDELFGKFHRGFWNATEAVWPKLYGAYEEKHQANKRPLFITGHSLGGAMATIAAAKLIHLDKPFISTYTFGQPRAMHLDTAELFNTACKDRVFRFQNNNDIVTRVPPRKMDYSHVGTFLYISEEKTIHKDPGFWFKFLDTVDGYKAALKEKRLDGIPDHEIGHYLRSIRDWELKID